MEELIRKIIAAYDKEFSEIPKSELYGIGDIDFYIHYSKYQITISALNTKTDRNIKFNTKKYMEFIDQLKREDVEIKTSGEIIKINTNIKKERKKRIIGYCRVSTKMQLEGNSMEEQSRKILDSYPAAQIYEEGLSGAKERPIFEKIINELKKDDILVVTKLDRFCRTTKEGLEYIDNLLERGIKIHILNMGMIENTYIGRLIVTNLLAFAEFERAMIIERTQAGKAIAKTKAGFKEGRPKLYNADKLDHALSMLQVNGGNKSYKEVERLLGISKSTLIRENNKRKV